MNIVEEYWSGAVQRLQIEVDIFNRLIGHAGEQGRENELALVRVLQNLIPRRLGLGSGIIIDAQDGRSKQTDIIIYDSSDQPSILGQTSQVIFPIETVYAAVEVKTTLTPDEIADCGVKRQRLRQLTAANGRCPSFVVLAYAASTSPATVSKHIEVLKDQMPDLLCVLDPGIVGGAALDIENDATRIVGLTPLHERDSSGRRLAGRWVRPDDGHRYPTLQRFGSSYPVTMLSDRSRIVGEPGRALLLFVDGLLRLLANQHAIPEPALTAYLTDVAREVLDLSDR